MYRYIKKSKKNKKKTFKNKHINVRKTRQKLINKRKKIKKTRNKIKKKRNTIKKSRYYNKQIKPKQRKKYKNKLLGGTKGVSDDFLASLGEKLAKKKMPDKVIASRYLAAAAEAAAKAKEAIADAEKALPKAEEEVEKAEYKVKYAEDWINIPDILNDLIQKVEDKEKFQNLSAETKNTNDMYNMNFSENTLNKIIEKIYNSINIRQKTSPPTTLSLIFENINKLNSQLFNFSLKNNIIIGSKRTLPNVQKILNNLPNVQNILNNLPNVQNILNKLNNGTLSDERDIFEIILAPTDVNDGAEKNQKKRRTKRGAMWKRKREEDLEEYHGEEKGKLQDTIRDKAHTDEKNILKKLLTNKEDKLQNTKDSNYKSLVSVEEFTEIIKPLFMENNLSSTIGISIGEYLILCIMLISNYIKINNTKLNYLKDEELIETDTQAKSLPSGDLLNMDNQENEIILQLDILFKYIYLNFIYQYILLNIPNNEGTYTDLKEDFVKNILKPNIIKEKNIVDPLKKQIEKYKTAADKALKKAQDNVADLNNTIEENTEKINQLLNKQNQSVQEKKATAAADEGDHVTSASIWGTAAANDFVKIWNAIGSVAESVAMKAVKTANPGAAAVEDAANNASTKKKNSEK